MNFHGNESTKKRQALILIISGVLFMLVIMIIRGTSPSATPVESIPPEILARLENLDKSFHNFVAIANKRTEAAYEENSDDDSELPPEEIPTERDDPKTLAEKRWAINQTFYKEFLKKHKVPKHPTSKWYVIVVLCRVSSFFQFGRNIT